MKNKSAGPWKYGVSPTPVNWQEAADALKSQKPSGKRRPNALSDKLDSIEQLLKDHK
jgi:hypothetical protein